jgi:DNA polymerase III subunit epsilon
MKFFTQIFNFTRNREKYLFFDTETNGLPRSNTAPARLVNWWPRMVQIAWLLFDDKGNEIDGNCYIIRPVGYEIPQAATKIHQITTTEALREGEDLQVVLESFAAFVDRADVLVAHNINFDEKVVGAEFIRNGMPNTIEAKRKLCTMEASTDYCQLPNKFSGYKWPKLSELHTHLFGVDFEGAHDALADIRATARCFWRMRELNLI